jgi:hypothetical protein
MNVSASFVELALVQHCSSGVLLAIGQSFCSVPSAVVFWGQRPRQRQFAASFCALTAAEFCSNRLSFVQRFAVSFLASVHHLLALAFSS